MTLDQGLAIFGIGLTIFFGVIAIPKIVKSVKNRKHNQHQNVRKGGIGIQSGRDTNLGDK